MPVKDGSFAARREYAIVVADGALLTLTASKRIGNQAGCREQRLSGQLLRRDGNG